MSAAVYRLLRDGRFAYTDHGKVERAEYPGVARQCLGKFAPAFEAFPDFADDTLHFRIDCRILQAAQGAQDGHPGFEQGMHLPAEQKQVQIGDPGLEQADTPP